MNHNSFPTYTVYLPITFCPYPPTDTKPSSTKKAQQNSKDVGTQTEPTNEPEKLDFSKYKSKNPNKYRPPKYRCIPAGYEKLETEDGLLPEGFTLS